MFYRKNLYAWEQGIRIIGGLGVASLALWAMYGSLLGYGLAGMGLMVAMTGVVGYCPMCAIAGRGSVVPPPLSGR